MNRRFISVLLALSFSTLAACGGDEEADTGTSSLALSGVYRPVDEGSLGSITSITFSNGKDYALVPASCTVASCVELGTYRLDAPGHALVLEDGATHETRSIAIAIVQTADTSAALVSSLRPLDLVDPGEQLTRPGQETTRTGQETTSGDGKLNGAAAQLLQLVKELIMAGQQMKRDDKANDQKPADDKKPAEAKPAPNADPNADPDVNPQPAPKNP